MAHFLRRRALPFALAASSLALGCSLAIDVQLECRKQADCNGGDDTLQACVAGRCEPATCEDDADCDDVTKGAVCDADGMCVDPWACAGRDDPREPEGDFASFELTLVDAITRQPVPEPNEVQVCEKNDPSCDNELQVGIDYDAKSGRLTIKRIRQEFTGFVRVDATSAAGAPYLDTRFYFVTRPLINDEVAPDPIVMLTASNVDVLSTLAGIVPPVDISRGLFLSRIHDCRGELAEGATLVSDDSGLADDRILFYADADFVPNQERSETFDTGVAGIANILEPNPDGVIDLQVFVGDERIVDFTMSFQPGVVSHAYLYPGYE